MDHSSVAKQHFCWGALSRWVQSKTHTPVLIWDRPTCGVVQKRSACRLTWNNVTSFIDTTVITDTLRCRDERKSKCRHGWVHKIVIYGIRQNNIVNLHPSEINFQVMLSAGRLVLEKWEKSGKGRTGRRDGGSGREEREERGRGRI